MAASKPGDRINNFILEEMVGAGSFGQVWRARHHIFPEHVAIKVPTDPQYVRNLQREGVAVHGLKHPNIVRALDLDPYSDPPYLVMEYVDGPSLRQVLDDAPRGLPIDLAMTVMTGLLKALSASHNAGVVHRDVKPANILLACPKDRLNELEENQVRITDFGLGRIGKMTTASMMQSGSVDTDAGKSVSGTLVYMSPEQRNGEEADARSDLYSCGVVLYELLTGVMPQGADPPSSLRPDLPSRLDEVFRRSYTRRERRYSSADEMLSALAPAGTHGVRRARPASGSKEPTCSSCGQRVHTGDHFCIRCGQQLVDSVPRCLACQAYVHRADRFCIFCGTDLRVRVL